MEGLGSGVERVEEVEMVSGLLMDDSVFVVAVVHWSVLMKDHKYPVGAVRTGAGTRTGH